MKRKALKIDYSNVMHEYTGKSGLTPRELKTIHSQAVKCAVNIRQKRDDGLLAFMYLPYDAKAREEVKKTAEIIKSRFDTLILAGTDPALLAAESIIKALKPHGRAKAGKSNLEVKSIESGDLAGISAAIGAADIKKTLYNICIKDPLSEPDAAVIRLIWSAIAKKAGKSALKDHVIITTDSEKGTTAELVRRFGLVSFRAPANVSGAFSAFSAAGLLPMACAGVNIDELLKGAAQMDDRCSCSDYRKNPAHMTAVLYYLSDVLKGHKAAALVPSVGSMKGLLEWVAELWSDSLAGNGARRPGLRPFVLPRPRLNRTDYRLFSAKKTDAIFTFVNAGAGSCDYAIPAANGGPEPGRVLSSGRLSGVIRGSRSALEISMASRGFPGLSINLNSVDEFSIGQFVCLFEAQAVFMAELYGMDLHLKKDNYAEKTGAQAVKKNRMKYNI